jgi:superfamily II DNA or RNA helicase
LLYAQKSGSENKYDKAKSERQKHVNAILSSKSDRRVAVARPGTGKTYLFKKTLAGKEKTLTLTFVNSLVEDLSLELCGVAPSSESLKARCF